MYRGTFGGGVFVTADGGANWRLSAFAGSSVEDIALDPTASSVAYAAPELLGLWKTEDAGRSWRPIGFQDTPVEAVAVDPSQPQHLLVGTAEGIYTTMEDGKTWARVLDVPNAGALAFDPVTPDIVYAGTGTFSDTDGTLYRSADGGETWDRSAAGLDKRHQFVSAIAVAPSAHHVIWAGTYHGVYRSNNGGASWSRLGSGVIHSSADQVAVSPTDPTLALAGHLSSAYRWVDGKGWVRIRGSGDDVVAFDPSDPLRMYAGGLISTNGGATWAPTLQGSHNSIALDVAVDPITPTTIYAGADSRSWSLALWGSTDGGQTWDLLRDSTRAFGLDPSASGTLYSGDQSGVYKSIDAGRNWEVTGLTGAAQFDPSEIVVDPVDNKTVYVGARGGDPAPNVFLFRTRDGGERWRPADDGLTDTITTLSVDQVQHRVLYAGTLHERLFRSPDQGETWLPSSIGLPPAPAGIGGLAIDPSDHRTLYTVVHRYTPADTGALYRSTDAGESWAPVPIDPALFEPAHLSDVAVATEGDVIYVSTYDHASRGPGVLRSTDGGKSWSPFNAGLGNRNVAGLDVDPGNTILAVGTWGNGVYTRAL